MENINQLEEIIKISFKSKSLLKLSLTHKSYAYEKGSKGFNERLEFLGDSILNLAVSNFLYRKFPDYDEGELSKLKSNLVSRKSVLSYAKKINLGKFVLLSSGEAVSGGRERDSILANAWEALVGAIYLDQGLEVATKFILSHLNVDVKFNLDDYKSRLQEMVQKKYKVLPHYSVISEKGPEHKKEFMVEVSIKGDVLGRGKGSSKKLAEKQAAVKAIQKLTSKPKERI